MCAGGSAQCSRGPLHCLPSLSAQKLPCSFPSASAWLSRLAQRWKPGHLGNAESFLRVSEQEFPRLEAEPQEPRALWVPGFLPFGAEFKLRSCLPGTFPGLLTTSVVVSLRLYLFKGPDGSRLGLVQSQPGDGLGTPLPLGKQPHLRTPGLVPSTPLN